MRRLVLVTLLAAGAALATAPASAGGYHGCGGCGARVAAGFALGPAVGAGAVVPVRGYDYVDAYVRPLPSNERYGYAWAGRLIPIEYPIAATHEVGPEFGVSTGWYGY